MRLLSLQNLCAVLFILLVVVNAHANDDPYQSYHIHDSNMDMEQAVADLKVKAEAGVIEAQFDLALHYVEGKGVEKDYQQAFMWAKKAADQNLAMAQLFLVEFYVRGVGGEKDEATAAAYAKKAAGQGLLEAQLGLASVYASDNEYRNAFVGGQDFEAARYWLRKAADQGSTDAMYQMADTYKSENYWNPDYPSIVKWLQRAVDAGSDKAAYTLAQYYLDGDLGEKNSAKATELYKQAALKGHEESINQLVRNAENNDADAHQFLITLYNEYGHDTPAFKKYRQTKKYTSTPVSKGSLVSRRSESTVLLKQGNTFYYSKADSKSSYSYYKKSADMGNILAKAQLAKMMYLGAGASKDKTTAEKWFREVRSSLEGLAQAGNPFGQYLWGYYYDQGFNGSASVSDAVSWYQKAADQGFAAAQNNLGNNFNKGEGVAQDYSKAVYWYRKAAEKGNVVAQVNLATKYSTGTGVDLDHTQAVYWYRKAAEQGYASSQATLGSHYFSGKGVSRNHAQAAYWREKAANQGHAEAQASLATQYYNGDGVSESNEKALYWYEKAADQGNAFAQKVLGIMCESGAGCADQYKWYGAAMIGKRPSKEKDLGIALMWYHTAAESGDTSAQKRIDTLMSSDNTSCQISDYNVGNGAMRIANSITFEVEYGSDDGCNYEDLHDLEYRLDQLAYREYIEDGKHALIVRFARRQFLLLSKSCSGSRIGLDVEAQKQYDSTLGDIEEAYQLLSKSRDCAEKLQQAYKRLSGTNN